MIYNTVQDDDPSKWNLKKLKKDIRYVGSKKEHKEVRIPGL